MLRASTRGRSNKSAYLELPDGSVAAYYGTEGGFSQHIRGRITEFGTLRDRAHVRRLIRKWFGGKIPEVRA